MARDQARFRGNLSPPHLEWFEGQGGIGLHPVGLYPARGGVRRGERQAPLQGVGEHALVGCRGGASVLVRGG